MEKLEWNLEELFINTESMYKEIEHIKELLKDIEVYKNIELDSKTLLELLNKKWKIKELSNNVLVYASLMYYKNVNDEECIKNKKVAEEFNNEVNALLKFIDRNILDLGLEKVISFIKENKDLEVYKLSLDNLFRLQSHIVGAEEQNEIKENNNRINEELSKYNNLLKSIKYGAISIDGKDIELTSSNFAKYISSRDRETRKQTYFKVNESIKEKLDSFKDILSSIYGFRIKNSNIEKYNSVLEKVLFEENINPVIIEKLIKAVNDNIDLMLKYINIKSNLLSIDKPHLYDLNVPLDNNLKIKYDIEDAETIVLNALEPLGEEYLDIVNILFDGHIDALPNENKHQSITFSWNTYSFMNFRSSYIDIKNMIHELGHIVNYYLSKEKQPFIYEDSTRFVGETASIINEILLNRYLYRNSKTKEEKIFYLSKEIENYITSVFRQTMYTEFEDKLYSIREKEELTESILYDSYKEIVCKYYKDSVEYDDLSFIEWSRLGHLYRWSYYPYKYVTGLLIASTVVDELDKKELTKEEYIKFLSSGSNKYSLDLLKLLNIDLINTNVLEKGFNVMKSDIEELETLLKEE